MKKFYEELIKREDFKRAVWMHAYHQNIQDKKIDKKFCPICKTPATIELDFKELK